MRLNRALEELEKVKAQLQDERRAHDQEMITKSEFEAVVKENKKLEKHKSELLVAFKKQMKLIDLLKRQRIHMEVPFCETLAKWLAKFAPTSNTCDIWFWFGVGGQDALVHGGRVQQDARARVMRLGYTQTVVLYWSEA